MLALLTILAILVGLMTAGAIWEAACEARRPPPPGRLVAVNGRRLHLRVKGEAAGPTVVIEQGAGGASVFWWAMQDRISAFARVATYDRAGYGWSDATKARRSIKARSDELHALLAASGLPGPYVLVGHSYGGPIISLFARDYPAATAGLVFADTPDMTSVLGPGYQTVTRKMHMPMLRVMQFAARVGLLRLWGRLLPKMTMAAGLQGEAHAASRATLRVSALDAGADDIRSLWSIPVADREPVAAGALGRKPVAVLSHGVPFPGPFAPLEGDFADSQARLAALSANSLHVQLPKAGHIVQVDAPDEVEATIRRVWEAARDGTALQAPAAAA